MSTIAQAARLPIAAGSSALIRKKHVRCHLLLHEQDFEGGTSIRPAADRVSFVLCSVKHISTVDFPVDWRSLATSRRESRALTEISSTNCTTHGNDVDPVT